MIYDVCVIGAGFGGISAAALLKNRGLSVCVLEKLNQPGGRAKMTRKDGFLLDWGMHVFRFAKQGPMQKVFDQLRVPVDWVAGDHAGRVIVDKKMHLAPNGPKAFLKTSMLSSGEKLQVGRIMARLLAAKPENWYGKTVADLVDPMTKNPRVRRAISYSAFGLIAPDLTKTSCGELIDFLKSGLPAKRLLSPVIGGAGQIITKLVEIIGKQNVHLQTKVKSLHLQNGRIDKAETSKGDIRAKAFVYNGPIMQLFEVIDQAQFPKEEQAYVTNFEPTSGISIDYALSDRVSELEGGVIGIDNWLGGYFPSNVDPTLAPAGKQLSTWFMPLSPADIGSKKKRDQAEQILRKTIADHFPAFFDKVMWERKIVCPVLDGVHLKAGQSFAERAPLRSATIDNLWFAGDTAKGKGCSSGIAFTSALGVADQLPRSV